MQLLQTELLFKSFPSFFADISIFFEQFS